MFLLKQTYKKTFYGLSSLIAIFVAFITGMAVKDLTKGGANQLDDGRVFGTFNPISTAHADTVGGGDGGVGGGCTDGCGDGSDGGADGCCDGGAGSCSDGCDGGDSCP